jgi:hypothetical protein
MTGFMLTLAMLLQQNIAPLPKVSGPIEGPGVMYPGLRELPKAASSHRQGSTKVDLGSSSACDHVPMCE